MFSIYDGRESFYQWDLDRKLIVKDSSIKEVHFCNKTEECSLVCDTYIEGEQTLVNVPNILLQTDWKIRVYGYTGDFTKYEECFKVNPRSKPADYIYTETEILNYNSLLERIENLEENGTGGGGSGGADGYSPTATVTQTDDGATITITDKNGTTTATITNGKNGVDGKDGYTPVKGVDYFDGADGYTPVKGTDYWTEEDRTQMVADVIVALPVYKGDIR